MARTDELAEAFRAEWSGGSLPASVGVRLVELCDQARDVTTAIALDERELVRAMAARARGDASYLEGCHATDLALTLGAARGSSEAIAMLERINKAMLAFTCRRFEGKGHTAEDLMQILRGKLFVIDSKASPAIADYDGRGSLSTWLRITAVRLFIDLTRRKDRAREAAIDDNLPEPISPADLSLDAIKAEYRGAVAAALVEGARQLEPGDRHLLRQHLVGGLSIDQLGAVLGVHRATAARRLARAREMLVHCVRDLLAERLQVGAEELEEIYGLVVSKLDLSMARLLATGKPTA